MRGERLLVIKKEEVMPVIAELFKECRRGNQEACRKLVILGWLWPVMARELKKLLGAVALVPIPKPWPGPDPAPLLDANFLRDGDLIRIAIGDPDPQPNIISLPEQLKAAIELRSTMERVTKALDSEIKRSQH